MMELTKYELARLIGARALQIRMGAPTLIKKVSQKLTRPIDIAKLEYKQGMLPITIRRR